jgi:hypothetical protein
MSRMRATILCAAVAGATAASDVEAAENAAGIYLLGSKSAMAGYTPPPGTYVTDINYYYSGDAAGAAAVGRALQNIGNITVEADIALVGEAYVNALVATWIAPQKVLGGNVGLGLMVPAGWKKADVALDTLTTITLPGGTIVGPGSHFELDDSTTDLGDPLVSALIGWHSGNWHWNLTALLNVPIGPYHDDSSSNISFNRWAFDASAAVTWLDAAKGHEVSVAAGFTFNGENPATDYRTGTEFHVEWALIQHLSKTCAIGLAGYHYQQVTGDSGAGAVLGDFEGRVTALGPVLTQSFQLGNIPVSTELKYLREFDAKNRVEGDVGFLTINIPLASGGH